MTRPRALVLLGAGVLALVAGASYAVLDDRLGDPYRHRLERYDDQQGERNRFVALPDAPGGRAQLSLGSPDGHRLVVQWRDPDGHGWTAPETVHEDRTHRAVDSTVRMAGGTVAVVETYTDDVHDDSDIGDVDVVVVCRDRRCTPGRTVDGAAVSEPQVTPDGRTVLFGWTRRGAVAWEHDHGFRTWRWTGLDTRRTGVSRPVLAPDGSLRLVRGTRSEGACRYSLLTAPPRSGDLRVSGEQTSPLPPRQHGSECLSSLDTFSSDWVGVEPDDHATDRFWFVRDGQRWTTTAEDPSGLVRGPDLRGDACCELAVNDVGRDEVASFSPDGRRVSVQVHRQGDPTWGSRRLLDAAPADVRCTWLEGSRVGPRGFALRFACHSGPSGPADRFEGDSYAVAVSPDLERWETFFVRDVIGDPLTDEDVGVLVPGRPYTSWTPEGGVQRLGLPQPSGTYVGRAQDGTYVRLALTEGPSGCTGEAVVADPGDQEWSEPVPGSFTAGPAARCRVGYVGLTEDGDALFTLDSDRATRRAEVVREGDGWRLRAGPRG